MKQYFEEVNALRQRILELEHSNQQHQHQIKQLTQQLAQEKADRQQAADRLQLTLTLAQMIAWDIDLNTNRVVCSANALEVWGIQTGTMEDFWARVHPDDRQQVTHAAERAIAGKTEYFQEYRIVQPDGTIRWVKSQGHVDLDEARQGIRIIGVSVDVTEQKHTEAALRKSEEQLKAANERFQLAAQAVNCLIYDWRLENDRVERTDGLTRLLGYSLENVEPTGTWWSDRIHPDDLSDVREQAWVTLAQNDYFSAEYRVLNQSNQYVYVLDQCLVAARDTNGKPTRIIGSTTDISDRKRAENERQQAEAALAKSNQTLQAIIQACPLAIMGLRLDGTVHIWNPAAERIFGWSQQEVLGKFLPAIPNNKHDEFLKNLAATVQGNGLVGVETQRQKKGNILFNVELWSASVDETQAGISCVAVVADITDRKQAEAEREQLLQREQTAREQAEAANRVKDEFLAVLSHELRTPLNPILGWAKLLQNRQLDAAATHRALETIERNAKLQAQLIEDLLDVSRILQGKVGLNACSVNLVTTIEAALETVQLSADAKGIQIQTILNLENGQVNGDANRLQQIVWNLLSNAVKFTPAGGQVTVKLDQVDGKCSSTPSQALSTTPPSTTPSEAPDHSPMLPSQAPAHYAQITISDTGQGISPTFLPYVFEYFRQADSSTTRQFGGLGLGLAIVRHLVELHGGTVKAESAGNGMGATFTVQLPLMASILTPHFETSPIQATKHLNGIRILVVDDEADMRELIRFILEEQGATVRIATSATEALQQLTESMPDILISDIGMPDMDGYALMRQIRTTLLEQENTLPTLNLTMPKAIALTAYAGEFNQRHALSAGFQEHVSKPVEPETLVQVIVTLLGQAP